jgi:uncharacterized protein YjbJ (UPF0337 family)
MPDKDRVKGEVNHPEGTVEEGVGTLKNEEAEMKGQGEMGKANGQAQGNVGGKARNAVPDSTHTGSGDPRSQS